MMHRKNKEKVSKNTGEVESVVWAVSVVAVWALLGMRVLAGSVAVIRASMYDPPRKVMLVLLRWLLLVLGNILMMLLLLLVMMPALVVAVQSSPAVQRSSPRPRLYRPL